MTLFHYPTRHRKKKDRQGFWISVVVLLAEVFVIGHVILARARGVW